MNARQSLYVLVLHGSIAFVVIIAVAALTWHGSLDAEAATALFGTAVGLAGGSSAAVGALSGAINGKATVSDATLRQAIATPGNPPEAHDQPT